MATDRTGSNSACSSDRWTPNAGPNLGRRSSPSPHQAAKGVTGAENLSHTRCMPMSPPTSPPVGSRSPSWEASSGGPNVSRTGTESSEGRFGPQKSGRPPRAPRRVTFGVGDIGVEVVQFSTEVPEPQTSRGPRRIFGGDLQGHLGLTEMALGKGQLPHERLPHAEAYLSPPSRLPNVISHSGELAQLAPPARLLRPGIRDLSPRSVGGPCPWDLSAMVPAVGLP